MNLLKTTIHSSIAQKKNELIIRLVSLTYIIQVLYSFNLWTNNRLFPRVSVFEWLGDSNLIDNYFLIILLLSTLCLNILRPHLFASILIVVTSCCLILDDINRLQPWVYIYLIVYIVFVISERIRNRELLGTGIQIIFIGTFFWSGMSKFNPNFLEGTFFLILNKVLRIQDVNFCANIKELGYVVPITEILSSIFLCFRKTRFIGVFMIFVSHIFIIYFVSPFSLEKDYIVIPWNILMILLLGITFRNLNDSKIFESESFKEKITKWGLIGLVVFMPSLNYIGKWDYFMSFSLYSDKTENLLVVVEENYLDQLDNSLQKRFYKVKGMEGGQVLNLLDWSHEELKIPFYPEGWVIDEVCQSFCKYDIPNENLIFLKVKGPLSKGNFKKMDCMDFH